LTIETKDLLLDSLSVQPNIRSLLGENGIFYEKHYCTVAWCCPSRVNLFTGRAAHNTNVTALSPPYGGYPKFLEQKLDDNYLPVWINKSGIRTYYVGKFMNAYSFSNFALPHPKGWTHSRFGHAYVSLGTCGGR
jgi:N-acetylglucosamine-6-sulfatase